MDCSKTGALILKLRKEKGLTQKALAEKMNISDRAISKWERGIGCPDVSLLNELSEIFGVNIEKILLGDLEPNLNDGGNMKKIKFYLCPDCGNVLSGTGNGEIYCCGRKLGALMPQKSVEGHNINIEEVETDYYITMEHEMEKSHYISFAAYVSYDRAMIIKMYPEQAAEICLPKMRRGELYICCTKHGLINAGRI